jgi:hypothetical protein
VKSNGLQAPGFRLRAPGSWLRALAAVWLVGAVVTWNMVFDAHIVKGARDYVDQQQLFIDGHGPRQDMERAMAAARSAGVRAASFWAGAELLPGVALAPLFMRRRRGSHSSS